MENNLDMDISNYTLAELMAILEIEELDPEDIREATDAYISKFQRNQPKVAVFFREVQSQLLQYAYEHDDEEDKEGKIVVEGFGNMGKEARYPSGEKQISDWYHNQQLTQKDETQTSKITNRKQKIQTFGNQHVPMKREQLATTDTFSLPVKQDSLNPNLKNTINRFINLDSQFRQYTSGPDSQSTNYTCDLSDTLKNTLKLSLYSYQIPFSWYVIDSAYGNTCFWIYDPSSRTTVPISIPSGNYTQDKFIQQLNASFAKAGCTFPERTTPVALPPNTPAYYNSSNGVVTLFLDQGTYQGDLGTFTITTETQIIFFDFSAQLQCGVNCYNKSNHYFNNTLGWIMGYRVPYVQVNTEGNTGTAILDLNGPKYLILVIDDYNQNHVNNSLVSISQFSNTLKLPSYYSPDLPHTCITPAQQGNNLSTLMQDTDNPNGLLIAGKYEEDYTSTEVVLPSAPRTLTNAQLYTINTINANNNNLTNYLAKAPTSSDILAILPVKTSVGVPTGSLLVEFSGSLQDSERTYFGPVNIERMAVKLLDDKGNILNLNGNDWCVSLIAECLYQY